MGLDVDAPIDQQLGEAPDIATEAVEKSKSVGRRAGKGMVWLFFETFVGRIVSGIGQLILAWLLDPTAFALLSMAYTVTVLIATLQQSGLRDVLVHRHKRFDLWATPAMWMSATTGIGAAILTLAVTPLAAWFYGQPQLYGMLAIMSLVMPIRALNTVPEARLRSSLKFRALATNTIMRESLRMILTVVLAWWGFGVYSFVIPQPFIWLLSTVNLWRVARPKIQFKLQVRRWKYLSGDSLRLLATTVATTFLHHSGDYMILGKFAASAGKEYEAGLYFYAFTQSAMVVRLFAMNLRRILFPALSQFADDRVRQTAAFLKSSRLLVTAVLPLCLLQAALVEPMVHLLLPIDYWPIIPLAQALSIGAGFRLLRGPSESLLMAQGRFGTNLVWSISHSVIYLTGICIGAWLDLAFGVAVAVMLMNLVTCPIQTWIALGPGQHRLERSISIFSGATLASLAAGIVSAGLGSFAAGLLDAVPIVGDIIYLIVVVAVFPTTYVMTIRTIAQGDWDDLKTQLGRAKGALISRFRKTSQA